MKIFILLLFPLFVLAKPFKVATYNVENLFDDQYQGTEYEEYIPGKHNWNSRMVQIKLEHTAEVICDLDADIIGLQEIENRDIFGQLIRLLKRVGCAYPYSAITHKNGAPIQVALLSRFPIVNSRDIVVSRAPRVRDILEADVVIQGHPLKLFVNHWKSKAHQGYESKRIAYAKALKKRLKRLPQGTEYVLLGDFNSDYNAYLTLTKRNNDTQGRTAFNDILGTKIADKLVCEGDICRRVQGLHYSLWQEIPVRKRWSQKFYSKRSTPDQIVLPHTMFDGKGIDYVNNSFGVFRRAYLFTKRGYINRWRYKHGKHMAKGYSDHLPIYAYFDVHSYLREKDAPVVSAPKVVPIEKLYTLTSLKNPVRIDNVVVVFKRGGNAVIKQSPNGRGIYLYATAHALKEGTIYDLKVEEIGEYHGLKEIISVYPLKEKGETDSQKYMRQSLDGALKQNEIVRDIEGKYQNGYLYTQNKKIKLYFKNKKLTPRDGAKLKIYYAHIGYYKRPQLVIYSKKDFKIME